jgi:hypothetical protein
MRWKTTVQPERNGTLIELRRDAAKEALSHERSFATLRSQIAWTPATLAFGAFTVFSTRLDKSLPVAFFAFFALGTILSAIFWINKSLEFSQRVYRRMASSQLKAIQQHLQGLAISAPDFQKDRSDARDALRDEQKKKGDGFIKRHFDEASGALLLFLLLLFALYVLIFFMVEPSESQANNTRIDVHAGSQLEQIAVISPFVRGSATRLCMAAGGAMDLSSESQTIEDVARSWITSRSAGWTPIFLLIGSTDRMALGPVSRRRYEANVGLAQARSSAVAKAIEANLRRRGVKDDLTRSFLLLISGPRETPEEAARRTDPVPLRADPGEACAPPGVARPQDDDRRVEIWSVTQPAKGARFPS